MRSRLIAVGLAAAWMLSGCGTSSPLAAPSPLPVVPVPVPQPPVPAPAGQCRAITYSGANGGDRIQHAIDDPACTSVEVDVPGPDPGGDWAVSKPIVVRSNLTVESAGASQARLAAVGGLLGSGILKIVDATNITIRSLALANNGVSPNGVWIQGSHSILVTQGTITGGMFHGIHINGAPSTDIRVSDVTFANNGNVDVRTDTSDPSQYHARVLVTNNTMSGSSYGVALSNCGDAPASACEVRDNTITHVTVSGVDLNRSRYMAVSGNRVSDCLNGVGVDDSQFATIATNTVQACRGDGIQMANGAVPANRPWSVSNNQVSNNTLLNNGGFGLASYGSKSDPRDRNESNTWTNNQINGNAKGGCDTNAAGNTFAGNAPQECGPQR